jgi:DNA modification methylase
MPKRPTPRGPAESATDRRRNNPYKPSDRPAVRAGDLWQLGRHRLLCADSTSSSDVARLLGGRRPLVMVTDPPYGVSYRPAWRAELNPNKAHRTAPIAGDERHDWTEAYKLFAGDVAYVWHAALYAREVGGHLVDCGFAIRAQIIWAKFRPVFSRGHYHWQHEPCWYAVRAGATASWSGDRRQRTLWSIRPDAVDDPRTPHAAQKPVECMGRAIRNHGGADDAIYDPFVGSGSTIIAAEKLDRTCLALEIDPANCQVAIARWESVSGQRARRL